MRSFNLVAIFSIVIAGLCILALPLWILGVPGVQNEYAKGWNMGLTVIWFYPLSVLLIYGSYLIIWTLSLKNQLNLFNLMYWQKASTVVAIAALLFSILRMTQALRLILGK
jgi:hypothetical protein